MGGRRAERHAGDDDDALAGLGEAFAEREPAGAVDHVVEVVRVLGDDAMHAPDERQLAPGRELGEIATIGGFGRSRATRRPVEPEQVQQTIAERSSVSAIWRAAAAMASAPVASGAARCAWMTER